MRITVSLVLYCNAPDLFEAVIRSAIYSDVDVTLSIVDNSPEPLGSLLFDHPRVFYHHPGKNLGFGRGHNRAFASVADQSDVHFIVNPDVDFDPAVIGKLAGVFAKETEVTAVMPAIYDDSGRQQHLCKALPTPLDLIGRRFVPLASVRNVIDNNYEFRDLPTEGLVDIPNLSGCFLGVRSATFRQVGGFDERFFMYMEDVDLVRRLGDHGRTVYVPEVRIVHGHARGSYRLGRLMLVHIRSAFSYFGKWGWLCDTARAARNSSARRAYRTSSGQEAQNNFNMS